MKRFSIIVLVIALVLCSAVSVSAKGVVGLELKKDDIKNNRLFDIEFAAELNDTLSGGEFEITYDKSIVEYRSVSSDNFEVKAKDNSGTLSVVFASAENLDATKSASVLNITFKSISTGSFDMDIKNCKLLSGDLKKLEFDSYGCSVSIDGKAVTVSKKASTTIKGDESSIEKTDDKKTFEESEQGFLSVDSNGNTKAVIYIIIVALIVCALFVLGIIYGKKMGKNKSSQAKEKQK